MKWRDAGNECRKEYELIKEKYQDKQIYIYGAGLIGGRISDAIHRLTDWKVLGFFDRDIQKTVYKGVPVYRQEDMADVCEGSDKLLLVGLEDFTGVKVKDDLVQRGLVNEEQCILYGTFVMHDFPIILMYQYHKILLDTVSMIVTERCTLQCEKCSIMLPYFKEIHKYPLEKLKKETDAFFGMADFVGNYTLTGGEPLLYKDLHALIEYIGENYREKIGSFKIITNGMLQSDADLLYAMKKYGMVVEISDYTKAVPSIKNSVVENVHSYQEAGIMTYFLSSAEWVDFGFGATNNYYSPERLTSFFDYCRTRCRGYVDGKLRYCINAYFATRASGHEEDSNNTFDLMNLETNEENKRKLVEFDLGYNRDGYLGMCQHCNGTCEINKHYIEVGKQCRNL